jgi:hypothetical protein
MFNIGWKHGIHLVENGFIIFRLDYGNLLLVLETLFMFFSAYFFVNTTVKL